MCVAMPGRVLSVKDGVARVDFDGNVIEARADLVQVAPDDRVLVHAGLIIQKLSVTEAEEMDAIFAELRKMTEQTDEHR
ncbi:MAG: HypC/HybG/HupF family hydrogenase formation chaperone [Clostridia bacterium]|nr:HypC/HybG/HupF family hydrogenase formation chaperone [Clostridia bacterium]